MTDQFVNYDYAWKQRGWTVQNPTLLLDTIDTYTNPGLPDDVSKVLVYGTFLDLNSGRPLDGVLQVRTTEILTYIPTMTEVIPGVQTLRFTDGQFQILLPATDDAQLDPPNWMYQIRLTVEGISQEAEVSLPTTPSTVNIIDLLPPLVVPPEFEYIFEGLH